MLKLFTERKLVADQLQKHKAVTQEHFEQAEVLLVEGDGNHQAIRLGHAEIGGQRPHSRALERGPGRHPGR